MDKNVFALLGPTACGKTALALQLADEFPCEIISMDSALIYRGMDIGTAKPTSDERAAVAHHLIDIITPLEHYSAADFVADCVRLVGDIHRRGRLPLIVGGTMMYYQALVQGLNDLPQADEAVRVQLQQFKQEQGLAALYARLQLVDPPTAARLNPNDSQRIERALEVFLLTGMPMSSHFQAQQERQTALNIYAAALIPEDRLQLHQQINRRFELMLQQGFLTELEHLQQQYPALTPDFPSMRCIGYRQAWLHLAGETDYAQLVAQGQAATRQLAKRQLTWLRKLPVDFRLDPYTGDVFGELRTTFQRFYGL